MQDAIAPVGSARRRLRPARDLDGASALVAAAVLCAAVVPLVAATVSGSLSIPHADAWSYSRIGQVFARTGNVELLGWNRSGLVGLFMVMGPFARYIAAQQLFVAVLGAVGVVAVYDLAKPSVGRSRAGLAALLVALWPVFGLLSTSFMLDVPTLAAMMVCLAVGRRAAVAGSARLLAFSLLVGLWAVTIREQSLAAPVAVLFGYAVAAWRRRGDERPARAWTTAAAGGLALLAAVAVFEAWRHGLSNADSPVLAVPPHAVDVGVKTVVKGYFLLALAAAPAVALVARPSRCRVGAWVAAAVAAVTAVLAVRDFHALGFFLGNYFVPIGPYRGIAAGQPALIVPVHLWWVVVGTACIAGVAMAGTLVRTLPRLDPMLGAFLALMVLGNVATAVSGQKLFDRYWMLALPPVLIAVLGEHGGHGEPAERRLEPARRAVAGLLCAGLGAVSIALSFAGMAFDTARWHAAQRLVAAGIPARDIDAGLEWRGYQSIRGASPSGSVTFPGSRSCVVLASSPKAGAPHQHRVSYRTYLVAGTAHLWVYARPTRGCPLYPLP